MEPSTTPYARIGSEEPFFAMVQHFYSAVETDPVLRPLYPADLTESIRNTALFIIQFCGGPAVYSQQRGHPRLRLRHYPFVIGQAERDAWVKLMGAAVDAEIPDAQVRAFLHNYFERTATFLINQKSEPGVPEAKIIPLTGDASEVAAPPHVD